MSKKITLKSSDGELYVTDVAVATQSQLLAHMVADDCADGEIPLTNVEGNNILAKVIEYCQKHVDADSLTDESKEEVKKWDANFMNMELSTIFDVMIAANYLEIITLLDLTCQTVADMIVGETAEQIRQHFGIENDFTKEEEEEEEVCKENQWSFE